MDRFERAEHAAALRRSGHNCSQAVAVAFADLVDTPAEDLRKLAAGFGGGMGTMEATCGALIGAGMVAGLLTGGRGAVPTAAKIQRAFAAKCGATICKDLKGIGTGKVLCPCEECVKNAVLSLCETLGIA